MEGRRSMRKNQDYLETSKWGDILNSYIWITIGALIFAYGLEALLIPNRLIDGGVVGISLLLEEITPIGFSIFFVGINIPFLIIGYKQLGLSFAIQSLYGIVLASIFTELLHDVEPLTNDPLLGAVFGGGILGIGVGIVLRNDGALDGTEILATLISSKTPFSVGNIVMFINLFIFLSASLVFGMNSAFYSIISYLVAARMMDTVIAGLNESKSVVIISEKADEIGNALVHRLGRSVTYFEGTGGYSGDKRKAVYSVITRIEEVKLKKIIRHIDPNAFVALSDVSEVNGRQFLNKGKH
jgi:uncharacterized membrane-anchored protein YitT (DUF2179 family)